MGDSTVHMYKDQNHCHLTHPSSPQAMHFVCCVWKVYLHIEGVVMYIQVVEWDTSVVGHDIWGIIN